VSDAGYLYPEQRRDYTARKHPGNAGSRENSGSRALRSAKTPNIPGFPEKNQEKPQKTCGNRAFSIDNSLRKPQG
jgi:hypothetical protein